MATRVFEYGGIETYMSTMGTYFRKLNWQVEVVTTEQFGPHVSGLREAGMGHTHIPGLRTSGRRGLKRFVEHVAKINPAMAVSHHCAELQAALPVLHPSIYRMCVLHGEFNRIFQYARLGQPWCDSYVAPSPSTARRALEHGLPESRITIVPTGVDLEAFRSDRTIQTRELRLAFLGHINDGVKNIQILARVAEVLYSKGYGPRVQWTIIGEGPALPQLKAQFATIPQVNVSFTGYVRHDQLPAILQRQDAMIIPSTSEAGPIVLLEAMASGVVPICSVVGFAGVVIHHEHSGFLIENGAEWDYAEAVARLADDRSLLGRLSANAVRAAQCCPHHVTFKRLQEMFETRSPSRERYDVLSMRALQVPRKPRERVPWLPKFVRRPLGSAYRLLMSHLRPTPRPK